MKLSDDILLTIFHYYLDASPRIWLKLVHICRRWRRIVFKSQRSLYLQLFCTPGTPVLKTLSVWPALPIVVEYGGSPTSDLPVPKDDYDNVVAALKHSNRVSSISLTVTKPLLEKFPAIWKPFSELENLVLMCSNDVPLTLSSTFRWGSRLHTLHLTRVTIPPLLQLLFLSTGLVDLQLHEIPEVGHIYPETFANALSRMSHLRILSLHVLSTAVPYYLYYVGKPRQPRERVTLLALRKLKYRGTSMYLDSLAARIDAPRLSNIDITLSSHPPPVERPQLGQFISRISMQKSYRRADILFSENTISISFTQPESTTCLELKVACKSFSRQLAHITWICNSLSPVLFGIEHLRVCATRPKSGYDYSHHGDHWQNVLSLFRSTKWAYVTRGLSTYILIALQPPSQQRPRHRLLPALHKLCIQEPEPSWQKAVESFIHSRLLSGHIIAVEYERLRINELHGTGTAFFRCQVL